MKTLILTCNTGQGHNSTAASLKDVFEANGDICEIADALSFLSNEASKIVNKCFTGIYRHIPKAFDSMYTLSEADNHSVGAMESAVKILRLGCKKLYKYIEKGEFESIICVHLFPALMVTRLKEKYGLSLKTALLTTDYTCYPFTAKTDMDLYFMPHAYLEDEFGTAVSDKSKLFATGIPIKKDFLSLPDKASAKKQLGLPDDCKTVFIMGGSMGCGPMEELVCKLSDTVDQDTRLLVSCGTNKVLLKSLKKKKLLNTEAFSFSDSIPTIMAASDLFVTKPGGISTTEAAVAGLPTVIINAVGGCETPNYKFFTENEFFYGTATVDEVCTKCVSLLQNEAELKERSAALKKEFKKDSATQIYIAMKGRQK